MLCCYSNETFRLRFEMQGYALIKTLSLYRERVSNIYFRRPVGDGRYVAHEKHFLLISSANFQWKSISRDI